MANKVVYIIITTARAFIIRQQTKIYSGRWLCWSSW